MTSDRLQSADDRAETVGRLFPRPGVTQALIRISDELAKLSESPQVAIVEALCPEEPK